MPRASSIPFYVGAAGAGQRAEHRPGRPEVPENYGEIGTDFGAAMTKLFASNAAAPARAEPAADAAAAGGLSAAG